MGHPTMIKVSFKELTVHTTDANNLPTFNPGSDLHYREINISEFSVTLNLNKKKSHGSVNFHSRERTIDSNAKSTIKISYNNVANQIPVDQKAQVKGTFRYNNDRNNLEDEYKKLREHETYLVFPFDAIIRIRTQLDLSKDFRNQPMLQLTLKFKEPIVLVLNTDNMKYLSALIDNFETMKIIQKNIHLRPSDRPQREQNSNIKFWWKYFKNAIIEDKKSSGNLINTTKWKINMKKYIDLYKRRQEIVTFQNSF
jgi:Vacuolar sorting-associated protein 13, N-terminal